MQKTGNIHGLKMIMTSIFSNLLNIRLLRQLADTSRQIGILFQKDVIAGEYVSVDD